MKRTTSFIFLMIALLVLTPAAMAQDSVATTDATAASAAATEEDHHYSDEELQQLLAPIALYPDDLLTQVMMASTYPLEVVEGDRWAKANKNLKGADLKAALDKQSWDDSVKALESTPDVLATMSENLDWTQKLGDAVLAQQDDVMNNVQVLRQKAYQEKQLVSNDQQNIDIEPASGGGETQQTIIIQSTQPDTVYVPYYNPSVVYGTWSYPSYPPPYYPPPPGYQIATGFATGMAFAAGAAVFNDLWDDDFDWGHHDINVNVSGNTINNNFIDNRHGNGNVVRPGANGGGTQWKHDPAHRHGVPYDNKKLANKFTPQRVQRASSAQTRNEFRGKLNQTQHPISGATRNNPDLNGRTWANNQTANRLNQKSNLGGQTQRPQNNRPNFNSVNTSGLRRNDSAFQNIGSGRAATASANRGRSSFNGMASRSTSGFSSGGFSGGHAGGGGFSGGHVGGGRAGGGFRR